MTTTTPLDPYKEIRPYHNDEVQGAIERMLDDKAFIKAVVKARFSHDETWFLRLVSPLVRCYLKRKWSKLDNIDDIQQEVAKYLDIVLQKTADEISFSGIEKLDPKQSYLFISNHRDIAMDPALVNWGIFAHDHPTVRIAIGDNLLTMPCASELMKLNKSFIVKRSSKGPREMMKNLSLLSSYIRDSLAEGQSIWIAQKEGRAKDGLDKTDPAILKMFHVAGRKDKIDFAEYMKSLKIVPVSISYENDPCDVAKARELAALESKGEYTKQENEDIQSIIQGIMGYKGRIHLHFGDVIEESFETPEDLALEIDRQIYQGYKFYPYNYIAANLESDEITPQIQAKFDQKLQGLSELEQQKLIAMYANPVRNQKQQS